MFSIQPILENENVKLIPLQNSDFEDLYKVASDPLIWEQHPNKDRYKKETFKTFFEGAMISKGAFLITDKKSSEIAGSTRFYDYDENENSIFIGYTFYARKFWGSKLNPQVKKLMIDHIFQYVDSVKFHVGKDNIRSQKAMEKLEAEFKGEVPVAYFGEETKLNVEYWISNSTNKKNKRF
jgi:RimJ/RimL family protein N-acetyltransferase